MNINIRQEQKEDYFVVENLVREAFWNLYVPACEEHFVVHNMRQHKDFIPKLSFVLELDNIIVGAIFYTHSRIIDSKGQSHPTISFGPVAIHPDYHRQGLGRMLISHSIEKARNLGYKSIITLGYPYHYSTYGFVGAKKYNISMPDGKFYTGTLALALCEGAFDNISGYVELSSAFEVDPIQLEQFDQQFPPKEKMKTPSQDEFAKAIVELDE